MLNDGVVTNTYDAANRLIRVQSEAMDWSAAYTGDGVRLQVEAAIGLGPVQTTQYVVDGAAPLPVVLQAKTGSATTQYLYATGTRPLAQNATAWEYLLPDALGSVRQIVDANGNVTLAKFYEPYGSVLNSMGSATTIFGYGGEQLDTTGLIYLRARYMQPRLGIFLTEDTAPGIASLSLSLHLFLYAWANPVNRIDPSGLQQPPPQCNFGEICATGPTGPYVRPTPPQDFTYKPRQPYPVGDDPVFGGPDFLGSLSPIPPNTELTMYDPFGEVAKAVGIESDRFKVPREFVAAALNYENHREKGALGFIGRSLKMVGTPCLQLVDPGHDSGFGYSMGIGNVKPARAETAENWFLTRYDPSSPEYQIMALLHQLDSGKLFYDDVSVLYVAADLRNATDLIYGQRYQGSISKEGARRIIGSHNLYRAYEGIETEAGNYGVELLVRASNREVPLWFFPGR